jgi:hypothetical protein
MYNSIVWSCILIAGYNCNNLLNRGWNFFWVGPSLKHWFKELEDPQAAAGPSQAFAETSIGQSLLKLEESQRKRLESLFNTKIR